jgi:antitoxin MazE
MQVAKWGNSLAIRLPQAIVEALELSPGDEVTVTLLSDRHMAVARDDRRAQALERLKQLAKPLPPGFRFDRDEANGR